MAVGITKDAILSEVERLKFKPLQTAKGVLNHALKAMDQKDVETPVDILTYIEAGWGHEDHPYPIQRLLLKIIYGLPLLKDQVLDNLPAKDKEGKHLLSKDIITWDQFREKETGRYTEEEFIEFLYREGRCTINLEKHNQRLGRKMSLVVMRMGRRSGKTTLAQWMASYEIYRLTRLYSPQEYYNTRRDQPIRVTLVATSEEQARELLAPARAAIQRAPILKQYVELPDSQDQIRLNTRRNMDLGVSTAAGIKVAANACSARSLRGPANILVLLEEYGFFNSELKSSGRSSNKTDREIYKAVAPSTGDFTIPGTEYTDSMIMVVSTPQTKESHMFELETFIREDKIQESVVFWIPTYWSNYTYPSALFRREFLIDPIGYAQEYEADYLDNVESAFSESAVESCRHDPCGEYGVIFKGETTWMGLDLGLKNDGTTIYVLASNKTGETRLIHKEVIRMGLKGYEAYVATSEVGTALDYLDIQKVAERIEFIFNYYGCMGGVYDQWNAYGLRSHLRGRCKEALVHIEFNSTNNDRLARHAIAMINQHRVKIYETKEDWKNEESLVWELAHLQRIETGGGSPRIRIQASSISGRHDDQYSAFSRALWSVKVGVEGENPGESAPISPVHRRLADSLKTRALQLRQQRNFVGSRTPPPRGFRRY